MNKHDAVLIGTLVYSFVSVDLVWAFGYRYSLPAFFVAMLIGILVPFLIDWWLR